ncbi:MAG: hypothetical protein ACFFAU_21495 [Candidatus Hodarchaeota archaeon]
MSEEENENIYTKKMPWQQQVQHTFKKAKKKLPKKEEEEEFFKKFLEEIEKEEV